MGDGFRLLDARTRRRRNGPRFRSITIGCAGLLRSLLLDGSLAMTMLSQARVLSSMTAADHLKTGVRIGPYEVLSLIGAGGMGEVYRAKDTKLGREVAIKVLPAAFVQDQERVGRLRREAQVLASFNHANIAAIHGFEEAPEGVALALEFVEGEDLQQRLRRGPIPVDEARSIARQVAEGLEAAHEKGIVHRDLKPANIKVTPEGQVKVLDFGLAKAFEAPGSGSGSQDITHSPTMSWKATEAGIILGTAAYMSPEQARGRTIDKRADIWSFGVVLFEMLSGKRLFQGETASDTLAAVLRQDLDWTLLPPDLPASDRRLVERCLDRDPKKRLRDIGEARIALEAPSSASLTPATEQSGLSRRTWLGIAGAGVAGLAGGFALGSRSRGSALPSGVETSMAVTSITGSGNVIEAAISPDGRFVAYVESEQGQQSLWLLQLAGGQTLRLTPDAAVNFWGHVFAPDGNAILYGIKSAESPLASLYSISTLGGTPKLLLSDLDSQVTFSPDGRRFAYTRLRHPSAEETALMVANADGTDAKALATFKQPDAIAGIFFGAPSWSPDGSLIATSVFRAASVQGGDTKAWLVGVRVATGEVVTISDPGWYGSAAAAWRPDGRSLLVIARRVDQPVMQIWSVDYPGGEARQLTSDLNDHRILSLTRDGKTLLSIAGDVSSAIFMESRKGGVKPRRISRSKFDGFNGAAFAGAQTIAYTATVGPAMSLWTCGVDGSNRRPIITLAPDEEPFSIRGSSDGALYFVVRRPSGIEIRTVAQNGSPPRTVVGDARYSRFTILPDGGLIFSRTVRGAPHLFRVAPGGGEAKPLFEEVAASPEADLSGERVAYYFFDERNQFRIGVTDLRTGRRVHAFATEANTSNSRLVLRDEGVYLNTVAGDRANVWLQPLDGKPARRITNYEDQLLFDFDLAPEGDGLVVVRGPRVRDAQIITGF